MAYSGTKLPIPYNFSSHIRASGNLIALTRVQNIDALGLPTVLKFRRRETETLTETLTPGPEHTWHQ